jgi:hypothetical protein
LFWGLLGLTLRRCSSSVKRELVYGVSTDYAAVGSALDLRQLKRRQPESVTGGPCPFTFNAMKPQLWTSLRSFLLELVVYAALVTAYYLLVLHLLGNTLRDIFQNDRRLYAGLALALIVTQGFLLEVLTRVLLFWIKPRGED